MIITTVGFLLRSSSRFNYVVQGACRRFRQLSWLMLLFRGFDTDLVLFWASAGRKPHCQSPLNRHQRKGESEHASVLSLCSSQITDTDIFGKPLLGSDGFEIQNSTIHPPSPFLFFLPERGSDQECLLERQTDRRLSVQTIGEQERDRG